MLKQTQDHKSTKQTRIVAGLLLSFTILGVGGCGATTTTPATPAASATPATSATQPSTSSQASQGQATQKTAPNPAQRAVVEISRLQRDQNNALTSDQKTKIIPILQELISTSNPSQDILQQKADAITAVFTDAQKTFLATPRTSNGNQQNANNANGTPGNGNKPQGGNGGNGGKQAGSAPTPQDMYQRVLDSLK